MPDGRELSTLASDLSTGPLMTLMLATDDRLGWPNECDRARPTAAARPTVDGRKLPTLPVLPLTADSDGPPGEATRMAPPAAAAARLSSTDWEARAATEPCH